MDSLFLGINYVINHQQVNLILDSLFFLFYEYFIYTGIKQNTINKVKKIKIILLNLCENIFYKLRKQSFNHFNL